MILVLAGTSEGRKIVEALADKGYQVLAAASTPYGGSLLATCGAKEIIDRPLTEKDLSCLLCRKEINAVVDATHPFATQITRLASSLADEKGIPYFRFSRPELVLPDYPSLFAVEGFKEAAEVACKLGEVIFLTTGSKNLDVFVSEARKQGRRLVVRILPEPEVLESCLKKGLSPHDLIAMQGPFNSELNKALLRYFKASVLVTKESGRTGGTDSKIEAAMELGIPVVVVLRPKEPDSGIVSSIEELFLLLEGK